nr:hypothetical protein [Virgibacillus necropolis]
MERRAVDSCGIIGIGETPQCGARGGSPAARGKRLPPAEITLLLCRIFIDYEDEKATVCMKTVLHK